MTPEELLEARQAVRRCLREIEDEAANPTDNAHVRKMTLRELKDAFMADWRSNRERCVEIINRVPRVPGDTHILPGDIPGDHLQRVGRILVTLGLAEVARPTPGGLGLGGQACRSSLFRSLACPIGGTTLAPPA